MARARSGPSVLLPLPISPVRTTLLPGMRLLVVQLFSRRIRVLHLAQFRSRATPAQRASVSFPAARYVLDDEFHAVAAVRFEQRVGQRERQRSFGHNAAGGDDAHVAALVARATRLAAAQVEAP